MKQLILSFLAILFASISFAQVPELINYQGVARDLSGNPVTNQNISLRMTVLSGSPTGTNEYSETHAVTTNNLGLFSIQIGGGTVVSGLFSDIDWGNNTHYLQLEMDENGGTNYTNIGTTQLVSVPYALYAKEAGNGSKWEDNSKGIYYDEGTVIIGDTIDKTTLGLDKELGIINTNGSEFAFGITPNNGSQYLIFSDSTGNESFELKKDYRVNGEPTMNLTSNVSQGAARHFNFRSDGKNHFTILGTGNVGVGTTLPLTKFMVQDGNIRVNQGNLISHNSSSGGKLILSDNQWKVQIRDTLLTGYGSRVMVLV